MENKTSGSSDQSTEELVVLLIKEVEALRLHVADLEAHTLRLDRLFHPFVGFLAASLFSIGFTLFSLVFFKRQEQYFYLTYIVPIGFPFVGFLFDRINFAIGKNFSRFKDYFPNLIDVLIVALGIARTVIRIPLISGHALFLTYALLTVKSWWVRIPTAIVLLEVAYFKILVWHDVTIVGGIIVGVIGFLLRKRSTKQTE